MFYVLLRFSCVVLFVLFDVQPRRQGHVRKRSEGSSFRGADDSTGRRQGFSREGLIHEYGKVCMFVCMIMCVDMWGFWRLIHTCSAYLSLVCVGNFFQGVVHFSLCSCTHPLRCFWRALCILLRPTVWGTLGTVLYVR